MSKVIGSSDGRAPRIYVGPHDSPRLRSAVEKAGGTNAPLASAEAIVYWGEAELTALDELLHEGISWVQLPQAGVENLFESGRFADGRIWTCGAGAYGSAVAEHALSLILMAAHQLHVYVRAKAWGVNITRSLSSLSVGVIGYGGIGRALVRLLRAFECSVYVSSNSALSDNLSGAVSRESYREILPWCDFVVLCVPSTPQTTGMISQTEFSLMRESGWLVNVSRGTLVNTEDLVRALENKEISGAALDVVDPEPLPRGHRLWKMENVVITPHSANPECAYVSEFAERVRINVERFARARPLLGVVDPKRGY